MIDKNLIKRGMCCTIPRNIPAITKTDNRICVNLSLDTDTINPLIEVEHLEGNEIAICYIYDKKLFGKLAMIPISHIENNGTVVKLEQKDYNILTNFVHLLEEESIIGNEINSGEPNPGLKAQIHYFLDRHFREKYGIKREGEKWE